MSCYSFPGKVMAAFNMATIGGKLKTCVLYWNTSIEEAMSLVQFLGMAKVCPSVLNIQSTKYLCFTTMTLVLKGYIHFFLDQTNFSLIKEKGMVRKRNGVHNNKRLKKEKNSKKLEGSAVIISNHRLIS